MVAGGSSDQVACVHPHKPQLAEIGFFQQFQNGVDVILSCHFFCSPPIRFFDSCLRYYLNVFLSLFQGFYELNYQKLFFDICMLCTYCTKLLKN